MSEHEARIKCTARRLADEQGIEMTPGQVDDAWREVCGAIRAKLRSMGKFCPDRDEDMRDFLLSIGITGKGFTP